MSLEPEQAVEAAQLSQPDCPIDSRRSSEDASECSVLFEQIVAQASHTCGVLADSKRISCWGSSSGMADWPRELAFRSVSTGPLFSCGARAEDGRLQCWGWVLPTLSEGDFTKVSVRGQVVCALRTQDGGAQCWSGGGPISGVSSELGFAEIAVSESTACAIRADDSTMRCWGFGSNGTVVEPTIHAPPGGFKALASAAQFFCAIRTDSDDVVCWGTQPPRDPPIGIAFDSFAITSYGSGCGIRADDHTIQCWNSRVLDRGAPVGIPLKVIAISGEISSRVDEHGYSVRDPVTHACALRADDGQLYCWGDDRYGQRSGAPNLVAYQDVVVVSDMPSVDSRDGRVCARRADNGHAVCLGAGPRLPEDVSFKQITPWCGVRADNGHLLCVGGTDSVAPPDLAFAHIAQRNGVVCGLRADDGDVVCFGSDAEQIVSTAPSGVRFEQLSVGQGLACGVRVDDGRAVCWGSAASGVAPDVRLSQIVTTRYVYDDPGLVCGLRADNGLIVCWGTGQSWAPTDVAFSRLSESIGCGIRADDSQAVCWNGTAYLPIGVAFRDVAAGLDEACGIGASDGRLMCWGNAIWNL